MARRIVVSTPIKDSFRVNELGGMFDVDYKQRLKSEFVFEEPQIQGDWKIGLIVGPSGSGKTTVAKELFGTSLYKGYEWSSEKAVVDDFDEKNSLKEIVSTLTSVGFSSPPSWIKPYSVLSNGEKFRCDLAKALIDTQNDIVVFDEFTSVVDRNVAKVGSLAISKMLRKNLLHKKFVAVSCHYDIAEWLSPDWVLDMATGKLSGRYLPHGPIEFTVRKCPRSMWSRFKKHHYLSTTLAFCARCYGLFLEDNMVGFSACISNAKPGQWRISRVVILPDYQGIGLGGRFLDAVGQIYKENGFDIRAGMSHPSILNHCKNSPLWKCTSFTKIGVPGQRELSGKVIWYKGCSGRVNASFKYVGE